MPRIGAPTDSLEGRKAIPSGDYDIRLDGFKPARSKDKQSTNLNPQMKVINNGSGFNDTPVYTPLNEKAGWIMKDFSHAFGFKMEIVGDSAFIPGDFVPDASDAENVEKFTYQGPLVGRTARIRLGVRKSNKNVDQNYIQQFYCSIQGCTEKHETDLK